MLAALVWTSLSIIALTQFPDPPLLAGNPVQLVQDEADEPLAEESSWPDPDELVSPVMGPGGRPGFNLASPSAILLEVLSGQVLFEKDADRRLAPASLTKIMTLLLAIEAIEDGKLSMTEKLVASENAESYGGTEIWLEPGEEMSVEEILLAIAVASANDASVALAEHLAGSEQEFVQRMNDRAAELGLTATSFANSHGLDAAGHVTTARDMATLCREAARHPDLLRYTSIYDTRIRPGGETWLVNRNRMVSFYQGCDGLKTGWTNEAGYSAAVTARRGGTRYVAVVMGGKAPTDRFADCVIMLNWAFANYMSLAVAEKAHGYGAIPVDLGREREVLAVAAADHGVVLPKGTEGEITREVSLAARLKAPIGRGDPVGSIAVYRSGKEIDRYVLVSDRDVGRISYFALWWRLFARVLGSG
jgi:D-alanyl-D-alanine carboxypeptidase (penicillin-binding protein 5/6)